MAVALVLVDEVEVVEHLLERPAVPLGALDRRVEVVHVGLVVLVVMEPHRRLVDVGLERVVGVGQRGQLVGHRASPFSSIPGTGASRAVVPTLAASHAAAPGAGRGLTRVGAPVSTEPPPTRAEVRAMASRTIHRTALAALALLMLAVVLPASALGVVRFDRQWTVATGNGVEAAAPALLFLMVSGFWIVSLMGSRFGVGEGEETCRVVTPPPSPGSSSFFLSEGMLGFTMLSSDEPEDLRGDLMAYARFSGQE